MMNTIKVIDSGCGSGKTNYAIKYMNENSFRKFIFLTPYLSEVKRVISACNGFKEPIEKKYGGKYTGFIDLVLNGDNIVSTHSLFSYTDDSLKNKLSSGGYELILDEVMDVISKINLSKSDREMLINSGYMEVCESGEVIAGKNIDSYRGEFDYLLSLVKQKRVISTNDSTIMWEFPANILSCFSSVTILSYMFEHSTMCNYLKANGFDLDYYYMDNYEPVKGKLELSGDIYKELVNIYYGRLNEIGNENTAFSKSWLNQCSMYELKKITNNTYNYVLNICKSKSKDVLWTTFKSFRDKLSGKGYSSGFISHSIRSTNEYINKKTCIYLLNKYEHPSTQMYFINKGINVNQDIYALSELVQWLFRSSIRKGEQINLYIPSKRMRSLLSSWLNGKFESEYNK